MLMCNILRHHFLLKFYGGVCGGEVGISPLNFWKKSGKIAVYFERITHFRIKKKYDDTPIKTSFMTKYVEPILI